MDACEKQSPSKYMLILVCMVVKVLMSMFYKSTVIIAWIKAPHAFLSVLIFIFMFMHELRSIIMHKKLIYQLETLIYAALYRWEF